MSNNRLELAKNLNIPRAERARPFVEESHGRIFSKAEIHALLMRFAEAEDSFAASETSALESKLEVVEKERDKLDAQVGRLSVEIDRLNGLGSELRAEVERLRGDYKAVARHHNEKCTCLAIY